jgi:hypothetical protein
MDYALEQLINGPAGSRPVLDVVMTIIATSVVVLGARHWKVALAIYDSV